jgi:hypothetical protein
MNELTALHGKRLAEWKKGDVEAEIIARWRAELGQPSQNIVGIMATLLRPPEAQRGGAQRRRSNGNGIMQERWNGSTLAEEEPADVEPVEGGTV